MNNQPSCRGELVCQDREEDGRYADYVFLTWIEVLVHEESGGGSGQVQDDAQVDVFMAYYLARATKKDLFEDNQR